MCMPRKRGILCTKTYHHVSNKTRNRANRTGRHRVLKLKSALICFFLLLALAPLSTFAELVNDGLDAYNEGDFERAFDLWKAAARQEDPVGQYNLAVLYYNGEGVNQDLLQAYKWFRKSAELGYADAQYDLGLMYLDGEGTAKDPKTGIEWMKKSAEQNHADAQFELAKAYQGGVGIEQNLAEAIKWYNKAKENGQEDAPAQITQVYKDLFPSAPKGWSAEEVSVKRIPVNNPLVNMFGTVYSLELERIYVKDSSGERVSILYGSNQFEIDALNDIVHVNPDEADAETLEAQAAIEQENITPWKYAGNKGMRFSNKEGGLLGSIIVLKGSVIIGVGHPNEKVMQEKHVPFFLKKIDIRQVSEALQAVE